MLIHKIDVETPVSPGISRVPPKRYLFDHGVRHVFSPVNPHLPGLEGGETMIDWTYLGGFLKTQKTVSWRKAINSSEVDFLFTKNRKIIPGGNKF